MTNPIAIIEREMSSAELQQVHDGFAQHSAEFGNPHIEPDRLTFIASDGGQFIGTASGLVYKGSQWIYLTDLFVEKAYRGQGIGAQLLHAIEAKAVAYGVSKIWVRTASYQAPAFYHKMGYETAFTLEHWYATGDDQIGLRKTLVAAA